MNRSPTPSDENRSLLKASGAPSGAEFWRCSSDVDWKRLELALLANDATMPQDRYQPRHIAAGTALATIFSIILLAPALACLRDPGALVFAAAGLLGSATALALSRQIYKASQAVINREGRAFDAAFRERIGLQCATHPAHDYVKSALVEIGKNRKIDMPAYQAMRFLEFRALGSIRYGKEASAHPSLAEIVLLNLGAALRAATGAERFPQVASLLDEATAWRLVEKHTPAEFHRLESLAIASSAARQPHQDRMPETARRL